MKLPDVYTDWKIVIGVALILLGTANWVIGIARTQTYSRMVAARAHPAAATDYYSFDELDAGAGGADPSRSIGHTARLRSITRPEFKPRLGSSMVKIVEERACAKINLFLRV